jgi:hypothetical protein
MANVKILRYVRSGTDTVGLSELQVGETVAYSDIESHGLDALNDVTILEPATDEVLKYNGTTWVNSAAPAGATDLDGLTDVTITNPTNGQVLKYNGTTWVNGTDQTGEGGGGTETFSPFLLAGM